MIEIAECGRMTAGDYNTAAVYFQETTHSSQSQAPAHCKVATNLLLLRSCDQ